MSSKDKLLSIKLMNACFGRVFSHKSKYCRNALSKVSNFFVQPPEKRSGKDRYGRTRVCVQAARTAGLQKMDANLRSRVGVILGICRDSSISRMALSMFD